MIAARGAARKAALRDAEQTVSGPGVQVCATNRPEGRTGSCLNKDKWPRRATSAAALRQQSEVKPRTWNAPKRLPLGAVVPKHVRHCNAMGATDWWLYRWQKNNPDSKTRTPYLCQSWRCPHCAKHEAQVTYARIHEACAPLNRDGFCFFVLTLDRDGYDRGDVASLYRAQHPELFDERTGRWKDAESAYKALSAMTRNFLKRLRRWQKRMGFRVLKNEWVAVVEAHKSGWPHLNLVLHSPELAEFLEAERQANLARGLSPDDARLLSGELLDAAQGTGWGVRNTAEAASRCGAWESYITKLAGETKSEIAKITQAPLTAPVKFRRLRAGKNFLPPRHKDPAVTGTLVRRTLWDGQPIVLPLHSAVFRAPAPWSQIGHIAACCYAEEDLLMNEGRATRWNQVARLIWPAAAERTPLVLRMILRPPRSAVPKPRDNCGEDEHRDREERLEYDGEHSGPPQVAWSF